MLRFSIPIIMFLLANIAYGQNTEFMPMVFVEGGSFKMGSTEDESEEDERPVHTVTLSGYWISKYEVTVEQYRVFHKETGTSMPEYGHWKGSDPIFNVSWSAAKEFANWLSERTGLKYNLPTEAQWEYAARGGNRSQNKTYAGSNSLPLVGWFNNNTGFKPKAVGQKQPNELGIYDMTGNVWEWCRDWYDGDYYNLSQDNHDPTGPVGGSLRVLRGGCWASKSTDCRVSSRGAENPSNGDSVTGFRLVCQPK